MLKLMLENSEYALASAPNYLFALGKHWIQSWVCKQGAWLLITFGSTIFLLQEYQWRANSNNIGNVPNIVSAKETWDETLSSLDYIATACQGFRDQAIDTTSPLVATPFLLNVAYQAALILIRMGQGAPDGIATERITLFKGLLLDIATRWKMASMYMPKEFSLYHNISVY